MKISEHFSTEELRCKCGCNLYIRNKLLIDVLEDIRLHFGVPINVTSSTRCAIHNWNVGGVTNSKHVLGLACDIQVKGILPHFVADYLEEKYPNKFGVGRYNSFTHIDVRKLKSRWDKTT